MSVLSAGNSSTWDNGTARTGALTPAGPRPSTPDDATPPPNCPVCSQPAIHWGRNERNGVTEANYLCANEHAWLTKWVAA